MPLERRSLFNPRLLRARLEGFALPDPGGKRAAAVKRWRTTLDSGRLERTKETQLQGQFLIDFFHTVLGYRGIHLDAFDALRRGNYVANNINQNGKSNLTAGAHAGIIQDEEDAENLLVAEGDGARVGTENREEAPATSRRAGRRELA